MRAVSAYLRVVHRLRLAVVHSGKRSGTRSWIVVARTPARCGGYIQSEKWRTSNRPRRARARAGRAGSRRAPALGERERDEPELDVEPGERARDRAAAVGARGREGDDLVPPRRRLDEPAERAADVVADAGERVRERRDVEDDPHGAYSNERKWTPSSRVSPPGGTFVGETVNRADADAVAGGERHA